MKKSSKKNGNGRRPVRRPFASSRVLVNRSGWPMPEQYITTMKFSVVWHETTAGGFVDYIYRGNCVYDPQLGVGGDSCYGLDQLAASYHNFKVESSSIEVVAANSATDHPITVAAVPTKYGAAFLSDKDDVTAMPRARYAMANYGGPSVKVTNRQQTSTMLGVGKDLSEDNLAGDPSASSPTLAWYWHVVTCNSAGAALDCEVRLSLVYHVRFYGLKIVGQ